MRRLNGGGGKWACIQHLLVVVMVAAGRGVQRQGVWWMLGLPAAAAAAAAVAGVAAAEAGERMGKSRDSRPLTRKSALNLLECAG
jgi:hypothetical protein